MPSRHWEVVRSVSNRSPLTEFMSGERSDQTAYMLDGVPVFNPYHAAGLFSAWNPDALSQLSLTGPARHPIIPRLFPGPSPDGPGLPVPDSKLAGARRLPRRASRWTVPLARRGLASC